MSIKDDLKRRYGSTKEAESGLYINATSAATASAAGVRPQEQRSGSAPVRQDAAPRKNYSIKGGSALKEKYGNDTSAASVERYRERLRATAQRGLNRFREEKLQAERNKPRPTYQPSAPMGWLGTAPAFPQMVQSYREDTSYREPNDKWQEDWLEEFGLRYYADPEDAYKFAKRVNDYINAEELAQQEGRYKEWSAEHPFLSTGASLLTAPFSLMDIEEKAAEYLGRGTITQRSNVTPGTLSRTLSGGLAEHFNEVGGTLPESIPVFGGKGWGDAYSLAHSALQSILLGNTIGSAGTLATYFGQSASGGMEEIKARGGTDEQAILYGLASGAAEVLAEKLSLDNLLKGGDAMHYTLKSWLGNTMKQAGFEGTEELLTSLANEMADRWIMGDKSNFRVNVQQYMTKGLSQEEATKKAWLDYANDAAFDFIGGAASGAVSMAAQTGPSTLYANHQTRKTYTPEMDAQLLELAMETEEGSRPYNLAQKYAKADKLSGGQLNQLAGVYEEYTDAQEAEELTETAREKLEAMDAEDDTVARAIAKKLTGQELNRRERRALERSAEGRGVLQDMQQERALPDTPARIFDDRRGQRTAESSTDQTVQDPLLTAMEEAKARESAANATEELQDTLLTTPEQTEAQEPEFRMRNRPRQNRAQRAREQEVNARAAALTEAETKRLQAAGAEADDYAAGGEVSDEFLRFAAGLIDGTETGANDVGAEIVQTEPARETEQLAGETGAENVQAEPSGIFEQLGEEAPDVPDTDVGESGAVEAAVENVEEPTSPARTIEEVAGEFGKQANKVREMYQEGQDVDTFASAVRAAWEMGGSGIPMERVNSSPRTQGITQEQRRTAYLLGQGAARLAAQSQDTSNAKKATGGTVRRKGVVKAQNGITIAELSQTFNDRQRSAYKLLSFYAEVTGIDVVLYKGTQEQETGRFAHGEDTIYIDITAGTNGWDTTDLSAYTMMRTFTHEFVHFVEKWSAEQYNQLREVVFAQMEKNGQDAEALVELAMQEQGLDFAKR